MISSFPNSNAASSLKLYSANVKANGDVLKKNTHETYSLFLPPLVKEKIQELQKLPIGTFESLKARVFRPLGYAAATYIAAGIGSLAVNLLFLPNCDLELETHCFNEHELFFSYALTAHVVALALAVKSFWSNHKIFQKNTTIAGEKIADASKELCKFYQELAPILERKYQEAKAAHDQAKISEYEKKAEAILAKLPSIQRGIDRLGWPGVTGKTVTHDLMVAARLITEHKD